MRVAVAVAIGVTSIAVLAAQETKPVPKDSVRVYVTGCTRGRVFTAGPRLEDPPSNLEIREGMHLRMNGPKKVLEEIKAHEGLMMVGITGLMKKGQTPRAACPSAACASRQLRPLLVPVPASAALASSRRPSTSKLFVPLQVAVRRGDVAAAAVSSRPIRCIHRPPARSPPGAAARLGGRRRAAPARGLRRSCPGAALVGSRCPHGDP